MSLLTRGARFLLLSVVACLLVLALAACDSGGGGAAGGSGSGGSGSGGSAGTGGSGGAAPSGADAVQSYMSGLVTGVNDYATASGTFFATLDLANKAAANGGQPPASVMDQLKKAAADMDKSASAMAAVKPVPAEGKALSDDLTQLSTEVKALKADVDASRLKEATARQQKLLQISQQIAQETGKLSTGGR